MAYIQPQAQDNYQTNLNYLRGTGPMPLGGGGAGTLVGGAQTAEQQSAPISSGSGSQSTPSPSGATPAPTGDIRSTILSTPSPEIQNLGQTLSQARSEFRSGAGQSRQFTPEMAEKAQGLGKLWYLGGNIAQFAPLNNQLTDLANAEYTGQSGLDPEAMLAVERISQNLRDYGNALQTPGGVASLVQRAAPQLTPGAARFESQQLTSDPAFQKQAGAYAQDLRRITAQAPAAQAAARRFALQREGEEKGIREGVRGELSGVVDQTWKTVDDRVAAEQANEDAMRAAWSRFHETGDVNELKDYIDPAFAETGTRAKLDEAVRLYTGMTKGREGQAVLRWLEESGLPVPEEGTGIVLKITGHGHEGYKLDPAYKEQLEKAGKTPKEIRLIKKALVRQQKELEPLFGERTKRRKEAGAYYVEKPLYFGQELELPDAAKYVGYEQAVKPSRENLTTEEQAYIINGLNELLGNVERIALSDPYQASIIASDVDAYLADEEAALEKQGEKLDERSKQWRKEVSKARDNYREYKHRGAAGLVPKHLVERFDVVNLSKPLQHKTKPQQIPFTSKDFGG